VAKLPPPHNLTIFKSYREVVLNRKFSEHLLRHPVAKEVLDWFQDAGSPEEHFFATMERVLRLSSDNLMVVQNLEEAECPVMARYTLWEGESECMGIWRHNICQFSVGDFPELEDRARSSLFVNKFSVAEDALAAACWSERVLK
jgi:hypothetical protein